MDLKTINLQTAGLQTINLQTAGLQILIPIS